MHYVALSLIFLVGLLLRILYIQPIINDIHISRDSKDYVDYSYNLFHHHIYSKERGSLHPVPDSFRSPGYPLFISLFIAAYGDIEYLPKLIYAQAVLGAVLVLMAFFVGFIFYRSAAPW